MLYLIGAGLEPGDLSLRGSEQAKKCDALYAEDYTNAYPFGVLGRIIGMPIKMLSRSEVESDFLVKEAANSDICLLVPGDPLTATTHYQLLKDCRDAAVPFAVIHSSSVFTAIASSGLSLYKFGRTVTLTSFPSDSPYDFIRQNRQAGLHTLILLDVSEKPMTASFAASRLVEKSVIAAGEKIVACMNLGTKDEQIIYAPASFIFPEKTPACIVVPGKLSEKEEEFLSGYEVDDYGRD